MFLVVFFSMHSKQWLGIFFNIFIGQIHYWPRIKHIFLSIRELKFNLLKRSLAEASTFCKADFIILINHSWKPPHQGNLSKTEFYVIFFCIFWLKWLVVITHYFGWYTKMTYKWHGRHIIEIIRIKIFNV